VIAGWVCIYSASVTAKQETIFDFSCRSGMQLIWICVSLITAFSVLTIDAKNYFALAYIIYGFMILVLIATVFLAPNIKGSHSWLVLGFFSVQPAEFAKFATALALAKLFGNYNFTYKSAAHKTLLVSALIFLPILIIIAQKEAGTALVFLAMIVMLYREGLSPYVMLTGFLSIILFVIIVLYSDTLLFGVESSFGKFAAINIIIATAIFIIKKYDNRKSKFKYIVYATFIGVYIFAALFHIFILKIDFLIVATVLAVILIIFLIYNYFIQWKKQYLFIILMILGFAGYSFSVEYVFDEVLQPHQQTRIKVLLGMEDDPQGAGWNVNQAQIAIGSGGFWGKGLLQGTQTKLKFVPEQDTDFIFCTIGEELGFFGSAIIILLFTALIFRLITLAERQKNVEARTYGYCVTGIFLFHFVINIGMVLGIMPVIGIPLPFFLMAEVHCSLLLFYFLFF
jgi:rod shape determining protein RodA